MSCCAPRDLLGLAAEGIKRDKHPSWFPPTAAAGSKADDKNVLKVLNSLTETLEPFAPLNGRQIKWYTCGPTVYDMSHMGHARAYLTFDILRRILEDYFGYSVQYQINITDIDDKIIKRARVNKLVDDFKAEIGSEFAKLRFFADEAIAFAESENTKKKAKLAEPLPETATSRLRDERDEKIKELDLKIEQFTETKTKMATATAIETLFAAGSGVIGELLDSQRGSTVSDQQIFEAHARKFEKAYFEDMHRLGIRDPDVVTRVTEYVPEVVEFVQKIVDNGFAYKGESSVFFDTEAFTKAGFSYPKLKPSGEKTSEAEMAEGEGALSKTSESEKKSPNDFALWKLSKPGEPSWPSPWGPGRPGWHIECSVMASDIFGENMDIHAGGWDLKFPHHDNECAQSEAYHGSKQWVNYFLHCGHLHIKGLKMSKSLKNFITIQQALDELGVTARQMRLLFLSNDWNRPMNFSDQSLGAAKETERVLRAFFGSVESALRGDNMQAAQKLTKFDRELNEKWVATEQLVHESLCNNFNTVAALQALMDLVTYTNQYLLSKERPLPTLLRKVALYITKILKTFGVIQANDDLGFETGAAAGGDAVVPVVDALVRFRDQVRWAARDKKGPMDLLPYCDSLRDELLPPLGIRLEDKPSGEPTVWKSDNPEILMKEAADRKNALEADRKRKIQNQFDTKTKEYSKFLKFAASPKEFFSGDAASKDKYSQYNEEGTPSVDAKGEAIPEKTQQKLKKEQDKYASGYDEVQKKEKEGGHYSKLKAEMDALQAQLQ
eukprot:GILI01011423.1.p1 GENE.GILI01011423.1~~GILI01011423.1.p1  ORF type:complete len:836 (-),score=267.77 GILI01011423.1:156-2495(-)